MQLHFDIGFLVAIISLFSVIVTVIIFFGKLRWEHDHNKVVITKIQTDLNNLGTKCNDLKDSLVIEHKGLSLKIESLDKIMVEITTTLKYVQQHIGEIKEKVAP
jgi:uncharacterized protein YoxC